MAIFWIDLLVESSGQSDQIQRDISIALAPLGLYPYIKKIEKVKD